MGRHDHPATGSPREPLFGPEHDLTNVFTMTPLWEEPPVDDTSRARRIGDAVIIALMYGLCALAVCAGIVVLSLWAAQAVGDALGGQGGAPPVTLAPVSTGVDDDGNTVGVAEPPVPDLAAIGKAATATAQAQRAATLAGMEAGAFGVVVVDSDGRVIDVQAPARLDVEGVTAADCDHMGGRFVAPSRCQGVDY